MSVAETSRVAYETIKPKLNGQQHEIWKALQSLTASTADRLADYLTDYPQSTVAARLNSLERVGYVVRIGKQKNKSGILATLWTTTDPNDRQLTMI